MPGAHPPLAIRYAARSDIGRRRESNQDTAYAGRGLLAVADAMGAGGGQASAAVIEALKPLEAASPGRQPAERHGGCRPAGRREVRPAPGQGPARR